MVFGLLSACFPARLLRPDGHRRVGAAYHLVVQVAMVWMVAAMPALMGMGGAAPPRPGTITTATGPRAGRARWRDVSFDAPGVCDGFSRTAFVDPYTGEVRGVLDTFGEWLPVRA